MRIGRIDTDRRVLVVAEIGNNHEGDVELAARMIGLAAGAGADAVKLQTFRTDHYVSPRDEARTARLREFELPMVAFERRSRVAREAGVLFTSTPFDPWCATRLGPIVDAMKIASGDRTFGPLLVVSTGLADVEAIADARSLVETTWGERGLSPGLALLHCVSAYPVPPADANLAAIGTLKARFGGNVGYSDHTMGIDAAVLAVAAGARIVEKHFTIDHRYSPFRDHALSADPAEFALMVRRIRDAETLLGDGDLSPRPCEHETAAATRRSIVAASALPAGTVIRGEHLTWVRPAGGCPRAPSDPSSAARSRRRSRTAIRSPRACSGESRRPHDGDHASLSLRPRGRRTARRVARAGRARRPHAAVRDAPPVRGRT